MPDSFIESFFATPAAILLIAAAVGVLVSHYQRSIHKTYARRVLEAVASALLLLLLGWGFGQGLHNILSALQARQSKLEADAAQIAQTVWGKSYQYNLIIGQISMEEVQDQIPREDPNQPAQWRTFLMPVDKNEFTITHFRGDIFLHLSEREKEGKRYRGYLADVDLVYQIRSDALSDSEMQFELVQETYPSSDFQDVKIWLDDQVVMPVTATGSLTWGVDLEAGQTVSLHIQYTEPGTNPFEYFTTFYPVRGENMLTLTIEPLPVEEASSLIVGIPPNETRPSEDGRGAVLTWQLSNTTSTREHIGVNLPQEALPGAKALSTLQAMPAAVILLVGLLAVTMLIGQKRVDFLDLTFFLALFALEFLALSVVSSLPYGFWIGLVLGLLLSWLMVWRWLVWRGRRDPGSERLRGLLVTWFISIALLVPLSSLWQRIEQQNAIRFSLQSGAILLIIGLWLFNRWKPDWATQIRVPEETVAQVTQATE